MIAPVLLNARNPSPLTGAGTNTYFLASRGAGVLVDAGVGHPDHLADLGRALAASGSMLEMVLVTHGHVDHASGALALAKAYTKTVFAKYAWSDDRVRDAIEWHSLRDGDVVGIGSTELTVIHTPGHAPDHLAFWHASSRALFTGDLVIPGGSVLIQASRGGNVAQYLQSLMRILELEPRYLFPGHGARVDDPAALVHAYIEHRRMRERQVVAALDAGHRSVEAIAESIYDGLDPRLMAAARETVRAHLDKLKADGIAADDDGWRRV